MEQSESIQIGIFLAAGTAIILLLAGSILILFYLSRRRIQTKNEKLRRLEFEHQQELLEHTILATEEERKRLASDLHDDVGTRLSSLKLGLNASKSHTAEAGVLSEIDEIIQVVRDISHDIMPSAIELFGVSTAIEQLCDKIQANSDIEMDCSFSETPDLSPETALALYRIAQELIHNTIKHAQATKISLSLQEDDVSGLRFHYADNGKGMNKTGANGIGLRSIENRARMMDAQVNWGQTEQQGMSLELHIPLSHGAE